MWNCCQLTGNQAHQSFIPALGPQPAGCDLPERPGFTSNAWDWCWPICRHQTTGPVWIRFVLMWQGADCTPHLVLLHQIQTSVPHRWGRHPSLSEYLFKVLTNVYSCWCIRKTPGLYQNLWKCRVSTISTTVGLGSRRFSETKCSVNHDPCTMVNMYAGNMLHFFKHCAEQLLF